MFEQLLQQNRLNISCEVACMVRDHANFLDQYESINLACGAYIASSAVNAKLLAKGANISCGNSIITDFQGEFVQMPGGTFEDGADFSGKFLIVTGDVILKGNGIHIFENVESVVVTGTVYYPASCGQDPLARVNGGKRPYPDSSVILLGDHTPGGILAKTPEQERQVWVAGEVSAFEEDDLKQAVKRGLHIACDRLFMPEGLHGRYAALFETPSCTLVPDGYTVTGPLTLNEATSVLYGKKLYVRGSLLIEKKDARYLDEFESILVKGCASMPSACAKAFKAVGEADSYQIYEGRLYQINGWELFSHDRLKTMASSGDKITLTVNGFAIFAGDVTAEDMEAIASLSCNGFLVMPGVAQGAISQRMGAVNGFIVDAEGIEQMTGLTLQDLLRQIAGSSQPDNGGNICTEVYMMS